MTPRQLQIFRFIEEHFVRHGYAPTLNEIGVAMKVTKVTVLSHLRRLEDAGHIRRTTYRRRGIEVLSHGHSIPLAGTIAAGAPIEALETTERIDLLAELRGKPDLFALRVKGDSMKDDGIHDGDVVFCQKRETARSGETVVALLPGGEATLKRFYREKGKIRLQPANENMEPLLVKECAVQGVVVGLYRKV